MAVADLLIGGAKIYVAPTGTALPADSTAWGTAWGGSWTEIGYTSEPLAMGYERELKGAKVQQALGEIKRAAISESVMFETALAEFTGANWVYAIHGSATTTAAGAGQVGKTEVLAGGEIIVPEYSWGIEGLRITDNESKHPVRIQIWKGTAVINGNVELNKEEFAGIPFRIDALEDLSQSYGQRFIKIQIVTADATS